MSSTDWEEIKKLAADFQRAQLTSTVQRLSERNCIELINTLSKLNLLSVYYTIDGREYLTHEQLCREMKDELYLRGGRLDLASFASALNVDIVHVQKGAESIARDDSQIELIEDELLTHTYYEIVSQEISDQLQTQGIMEISYLAQKYSFSRAKLISVLRMQLPKSSEVILDENSNTIFTSQYISKHQGQAKGALLAITQPVPISQIMARHSLKEDLFLSMAAKLITSGQVRGSITSRSNVGLAMFIPEVYSKAQQKYVKDFLNQNKYIEYDSLKNLGISSPENYLKSCIGCQQMVFLSNACISQLFLDQIEASLEHAMANDGFVDLLPYLPSSLSSSDVTEIINLCIKSKESPLARGSGKARISVVRVFRDGIAMSENLITMIQVRLEEQMLHKAKEEALAGKFNSHFGKMTKGQAKSREVQQESKVLSKKDERKRKAASGKTGGGTQGRETKTKSVKKHLKTKRPQESNSEEEDEDADHSKSSQNRIEYMSSRALQDTLSSMKELEDAPEELVEELALELQEELSQKYQEFAYAAFMEVMAGAASVKKKTHQQLQDKVSLLVNTVGLSHKGLQVFSEDIQSQLSKYLLKTLCSELFNEIVLYLSEESVIESLSNKELSPEVRVKVIKEMEGDLQQALMGTHKALAGSSVDCFLDAVDDALSVAEILIKKKDNKKERQFLATHRQGLLEQLNSSLDPAVTLHLTCLLLFQALTGNILHATGKFVPHVLAHAKPFMPHDVYDVLHEFQGLVMKSLTLKSDDAELSSVSQRLEELMPRVKEVGATFKKSRVDE